MIGLIFLGIIVVYLILVIAVPTWLVRMARGAQYGLLGRLVWGLFGFLLMTAPIFWDWIPTVMAHNHYCKKDAGVFIYKTVEQWRAENPGVAETLSANYKKDSVRLNGDHRYFINERHVWDVKNRKHDWGIREREESIVDLKTNEVLALHRDFNTGVYGGNMVGGTGGGFRDWKLWMRYSSCEPGDPDPSKRQIEKKFSAVRSSYYSLGEKK